MADYTDSKSFPTKSYPVEAKEASNLLRRCEPILTPELLKSRYLKGVSDEVSAVFTEEGLKDEIMRGMNEFELMTGIPTQKVQFKERLPFDRAAYQAMVYMKLNNGPVQSVEDVVIESSNGENIYRLPPDWIEMGLAHKRQINLIPILSIFGAAGLRDGQASNAGLIFLQAVNNYRWLPAFYSVTYTCGVSKTEGQLPVVVNEIVGMIAAIEVLSQMSAKNKHTSTSISQDGISQAASGPGPQLYKQRIEELMERKERMMKKLRSEFHQKYFMSNI